MPRLVRSPATAVGLYLLTGLRAETDRPTLWLWMVIAGIGIGPSFAVFTLIVQNSVSPDRIGAATSALTFFQQIGGTVGLTIAGTTFADRLTAEIPAQLTAAGVPLQFVAQFAAGGGGGGGLDLTGTGDLGQRILAVVPAAFTSTVEPMIPAIVHGTHEAFSIAVASTFRVGIAGAVLAAALVVFLREAPARQAAPFPMVEGPEAEPAD